MSDEWIIAGLGNPGRQYEETRHNIGFMAVDSLASGGRWQEKGGAEYQKLNLFGESIVLVKPLEYMNLSGQPLQTIVGFYKVPRKRLVVIHDDIDLELGRIILRQGGGDGGHNGLKSITQSLGGNDYFRVRLGVGRPKGEKSEMEVSSWVLSKFSTEESESVERMLKGTREAVELLLSEGLKKAQNFVNRSK